MDQSFEVANQIEEDFSINRHDTRESHLKMDDACIMEMTSSTLWKKCGVAEKPPKGDVIPRSLDSLARTSSPRAQPNDYETFYKATVTRSQPSLSDTLSSETKTKPDQRRTEMTDSEGLCTSDSFTASSELSESKYEEPTMSRPTSRLAQRHQERKEQYLIEQQQQRRRLHEQYPQVSSSNTNEYTPISSSCYGPETPSVFKASSHYGSCRNYDDYLEDSRGMRLVDSRNTSPYEPWEDMASKRRSRDGTLPSTRRSQIWEQREQKSSQNENYRHKNRRSTPSPTPGCWSTNTSFSYGNRLPSQVRGSTTTLASYVDEYQQPRRHRDPNRPPRKHKSRSSSVNDLTSVIGAHKKRPSEQQSISSRLESDRYSRRSEHRSRHDRSLDGKSIGRMSARSGQLQNEQSSTLSSQLSIIDDIDFASIYGMNTRKMMGPLLLGMLVVIMLLSLGLAIYFALGRSKDAEFSTANIRLRIVNSTFGEDLNYLSKPTFERLSSEYCQQMDRYYLQSVLKKRYRGCDVISLKRQFINFTLYFTEKDISDQQVESVMETSVTFVDNPVGTRTAIIDKFEIEFSGITVVISQKTEKLDFDKTRLEVEPEVGRPSPTTRQRPESKSKSKSISPPKSDIDKNIVINISNVDVHPEEKHHINEVPQKRLTTPTPKRESTVPRLKLSNEIPQADPCTTRKTGKLIPHPVFCDKFYQCVHGTGIIQSCQKGTWFDPKLHVCGLRPKGVECTSSYKLEHLTLSSSTARVSRTPTTTAMVTPSPSSPKSASSSANEANTPFLFATNISPADTVVKVKQLSADNEGEVLGHKDNNIGAQLKHVTWKSTTVNSFEGPIQEPCTTSLMDQYHPHPDGCDLFQHCVNGKPEKKSCPSDFVFDFKSASCVRNASGFTCPDFFPCRRTGTRNYFPHPYHCHLYIQCEFGKEKLMECASELVFDPIVKTCTTRLSTNDWKCPEERRGKRKTILTSVP